MLAASLPAAAPARVAALDSLGRILRNARVAALANPRNAGLYAGSVTITDNGAVQPSTTTASYPLTPTARGIFHVVGGTVSTSSNNIVAATQDAGTHVTTMARVEAMTNARYVAVKVRPSTRPYRFLVDGRFVSTTGTLLATQTGASAQYLFLDFGTRAVRRLAVDLSKDSGVYGFLVEPSATAWPVDLSDSVHAVMLGDSYVAGSGPTMAADGVTFQMGDWLGMHVHASGIGGTGWTTGNASYNFGIRIAAGDLGASYYTPDVIFLMASYNDRGATSAAMTAAVAAGLTATRQLYPGVPILLFGSAPGATGPSTGTISVTAAELAAQAAVTATGDPLIRFVPVSTDAGGAWISGTGKVGTTTGTGNSDWTTASDGVHPSDEGAALLGRRYAEGALKALSAMYRA